MIRYQHPLFIEDIRDPRCYGDPIAYPCPKCRGQLVYNGNYFCAEPTKTRTVILSSGDGYYEDAGCGWALKERKRETGKVLALELDLITSLCEYRRDEHTAFYVGLSAGKYMQWTREHVRVPT